MSDQSESREAEILVADILRMTSTVPPKVMSAGTSNTAKQFKEHATKARGVAMLRTRNLAKLRAAYALISFYYN